MPIGILRWHCVAGTRLPPAQMSWSAPAPAAKFDDRGASRDCGPVVTVAHIDGTRDLPALYVERVPARTHVDIAVDRSWIAETEIDMSVVAQARRR